jgi:hypothetical protein
MDERERPACPNDTRRWAIIEWAHEQGHQVVDMGGMLREQAHILLDSDDPSAALLSGGTRSKASYGGAVKLHPTTYRRIIRPIGHLSYRLPTAILRSGRVGSRAVNLLRRT